MTGSFFSLSLSQIARFGPVRHPIAPDHVTALTGLTRVTDGSGSAVLHQTGDSYALHFADADGRPDPARPLAEGLRAPAFCAPACIVFGLEDGPRIVLALNGFPGDNVTALNRKPTLSGFVTGTKMLGRAGIVPVEKLTAGDLLWTMHHGMRPVRWIARRQVPVMTQPPENRPVQVRADAFGRGCPTDPLVLMPTHAVYISDLQLAPGLAGQTSFLPAQSLLDDDKVTRLAETDTLEVIHLGLDVSDVVYASGLMVQNPEEATSRPTRSPDGKIEDFLSCFPALRGLFRFAHAGPMAPTELPRAGCG